MKPATRRTALWYGGSLLRNSTGSILLILLILLAHSDIIFAAGNTPTVTQVDIPGLPQDAAFRLLPDKLFFDELIKKIRQANKDITMGYYLCKPDTSQNNRPTAILNELIIARNRGVAVSILLDNSGYFEHVDKANRRTATILKKAGIKVVFDSPSKTTHVKMAVIDQLHCFIGSHNLTQAALTYNNELTLLVESPVLAGQLLSYWQGIQ